MAAPGPLIQVQPEAAFLTLGQLLLQRMIEDEEFEKEVQSLSQNPEFRAMLAESEAQIAAGQGLTLEEVRKELGIE